MAESVYEAKKIIFPLGLEVEKIHAFENSYVLTCGEYEDIYNCPSGDNADDGNEPVKIRGRKGKRGVM